MDRKAPSLSNGKWPKRAPGCGTKTGQLKEQMATESIPSAEGITGRRRVLDPFAEPPQIGVRGT